MKDELRKELKKYRVTAPDMTDDICIPERKLLSLFTQHQERVIERLEKEKLDSVDKFYGKGEIEHGFETAFNKGIDKAINIIKGESK